jgi:hypothetical protein
MRVEIQRTALVFLAALSSACGSSDHVDLVHDLRLLAAKAEPPNEVLPVVLLPDGGALLLPSVPTHRGPLGTPPDSGAYDAGPLLVPMAITALVADPAGGGRPIQYQISVCAEVDSSTHRCLPSTPDYQLLSSGSAVPPDGKSVEINAAFVPSVKLLADAINLDTYHGIDGLNVPIDINVTAGAGDAGGEDDGVKLVVFTFPSLAQVFSDDGGPLVLPAPFSNPTIEDLAVDGTLWDPADAGLVLNDQLLGGPTGTKKSGVVTGAATTGFQFYPVPPADVDLDYTLPTFTGGTIDLTEAWRYHFYGTAGTFSPAASGGYNTAMSVANPIDSLWNPASTDPEQDVWFWIVVDNGRGGTDWIERHGHYVP